MKEVVEVPATIRYEVCGHCGRDITAEDYTACKWCSEPICGVCAEKAYCPRTKELFPNPPEEAGESNDSSS